MMSLPIGLFAFIVIIGLSAGEVKLDDYLNAHSIIIVCGGSLAVWAIGTPNSIMLQVCKNIKALFRRRILLTDYRDELMKLAENRTSVQKSNDELIQYAIGLWERGVDPNSFQALLSQYRDQLENHHAEASSSLHNLSKYPPALGMLGTVMGMISLFANLGTSDKSMLGPSLAVAMTATFYGLLMVNAFLSPIADRLTVEHIHRKKLMGQIYEVLTLINRREPVNLIEEEYDLREAA